MKNLRSNNLTEFRDVSDSFHLCLGRFNMKILGFAEVSFIFI